MKFYITKYTQAVFERVQSTATNSRKALIGAHTSGTGRSD